MQRYKSFVLPVALVAGYFLRGWCAAVAPVVPYVIFAILCLTFSGVRLDKLRPSWFDLILALFQIVFSSLFYVGVKVMTGNEVLAQGAMICVLCPVASSVTVVSSMLGANPVRTTTYTIVGNLMVAAVAPVMITFIGDSGDGFLSYLGAITLKIASVIALPFFVILILQEVFPPLNEKIARVKQYSFYLWAFALFTVIGQTADFVVNRWKTDFRNVIWLGVLSLIICILQFYSGRVIGRRYGDIIAGGQLLGQKNSAMGIWILNSFLNPIASVSMAFYSIWQNIFNSWQIYRHSNKKEPSLHKK